MIKLENRLILP